MARPLLPCRDPRFPAFGITHAQPHEDEEGAIAPGEAKPALTPERDEKVAWLWPGKSVPFRHPDKTRFGLFFPSFIVTKEEETLARPEQKLVASVETEPGAGTGLRSSCCHSRRALLSPSSVIRAGEMEDGRDVTGLINVTRGPRCMLRTRKRIQLQTPSS